MGPYCRYCSRRCFLLRVLRSGRTLLMATCPRGMEHDLKACGETHETAINVVLEPERVVELMAAAPLACEECGLPVTPSGQGWVVVDTGTSADGLTYCPPDPDAAGTLGVHRPATPAAAGEVSVGA